MKQPLLVDLAGAQGRPSPVYWAGASLKRPDAAARPPALCAPSPVYWAGASLKPLTFRKSMIIPV